MSRALVITGMHRSGTSLITSFLQACGLDVGERLHPEDRGNPRGYYEDVDFLHLHQNLMKVLEIPLFPTGKSKPKSIPDEFYMRAKLMIQERNSKHSIWGWKDCRTALFLPFWNEIEPDLKFLFLFRSPVAVVDSLLRRGTDYMIERRPSVAFQSWWVHNQRITQFYRQNRKKCFLIDINDLVDDPNAAISHLFLKLSIALPVQDFTTVYSSDALKIKKSSRDIYLMLRYPFQTWRCLRLNRHMKILADWPKLICEIKTKSSQ